MTATWMVKGPLVEETQDRAFLEIGLGRWDIISRMERGSTLPPLLAFCTRFADHQKPDDHLSGDQK